MVGGVSRGRPRRKGNRGGLLAVRARAEGGGREAGRGAARGAVKEGAKKVARGGARGAVMGKAARAAARAAAKAAALVKEAKAPVARCVAGHKQCRVIC